MPKYLFITNANEHENSTLKAMQLSKSDTVTFDKGYYNYELFAEFREKGVLFVTRLKENAKYTVIERRCTDSRLVPTEEMIVFSGKWVKKNCPHKLRKIESVDEKTGNVFTM